MDVSTNYRNSCIYKFLSGNFSGINIRYFFCLEIPDKKEVAHMKPTTFAIRGAVCFSTAPEKLTCFENAFVICQTDAPSVFFHSFRHSLTEFLSEMSVNSLSFPE